jgi:hypothetical protein
MVTTMFLAACLKRKLALQHTSDLFSTSDSDFSSPSLRLSICKSLLGVKLYELSLGELNKDFVEVSWENLYQNFRYSSVLSVFYKYIS